MRAELVRCWPIVTEALATIEVAPLEVKLRNTSTQIKYRIWARRPDGRRVHLCTPFETESRARNVFSMTQRKVAAEEVREGIGKSGSSFETQMCPSCYTNLPSPAATQLLFRVDVNI